MGLRQLHRGRERGSEILISATFDVSNRFDIIERIEII